MADADAQAVLAEKLAQWNQPATCPECSGQWSIVNREINEAFKEATDPERGAQAARLGVPLQPHEMTTTVVSWRVTLTCENDHTLDFIQFASDFAPPDGVRYEPPAGEA